MSNRRRWAAALAAAMALTALPISVGSVASAGVSAPELRLISLREEVRAFRSGSHAWIDPRMLLGVSGADFELEAARPDYDTPVTAGQLLPDGSRLPLPEGSLDGWLGLRAFFRVTITDRSGDVRIDRWVSFCPNVWNKTRIGPDGPSLPVYPQYCSWNPFTLGMVYGIEQDWGANLADGVTDGMYWPLKEGRYRMRVAITGRYVRLFDVPPDGAAATVTLVVRDRRGGMLERAGRMATDDDGSSTPVPIVRAPGQAGLPDLQPLPSWDITTRHMRRGDFLSFAANVWVGGNGPLVVEGFRRQGEEVMDAYQYFWEDGQPVGRARVGSMEYDPRRGHEHWHFKQFAAYQLLAADRTTVVKSSKEAFCLVPTDAIDLTLPAAELQPGNVGLWTSCGGRSDLWIREVLPVGWGDTYYQYVPGQSFDITEVPNGTYFVKIVANPGRQLEELSYGNNVRLRKVILRGRPGHRRVEVPPWHGIDTEGWVERYGLGPSVG